MKNSDNPRKKSTRRSRGERSTICRMGAPSTRVGSRSSPFARPPLYGMRRWLQPGRQKPGVSNLDDKADDHRIAEGGAELFDGEFISITPQDRKFRRSRGTKA